MLKENDKYHLGSNGKLENVIKAGGKTYQS